jgi:hypothetical protein
MPRSGVAGDPVRAALCTAVFGEVGAGPSCCLVSQPVAQQRPRRHHLVLQPLADDAGWRLIDDRDRGARLQGAVLDVVVHEPAALIEVMSRVVDDVQAVGQQPAPPAGLAGHLERLGDGAGPDVVADPVVASEALEQFVINDSGLHRPPQDLRVGDVIAYEGPEHTGALEIAQREFRNSHLVEPKRRTRQVIAILQRPHRVDELGQSVQISGTETLVLGGEVTQPGQSRVRGVQQRSLAEFELAAGHLEHESAQPAG